MTSVRIDHPDRTRELLRAAVGAVAEEITRFSLAGGATGAEGDKDALAGAWAALVELLALGPSLEIRDCPACGCAALAAATTCGYCWSPIEPLAAMGAQPA